jgi:hypothetical protein
MEAGILQNQLELNKPGDIYEQQTDRIAKQVMRMLDIEKGQNSIYSSISPIKSNKMQRIIDPATAISTGAAIFGVTTATAIIVAGGNNLRWSRNIATAEGWHM